MTKKFDKANCYITCSYRTNEKGNVTMMQVFVYNGKTRREQHSTKRTFFGAETAVRYAKNLKEVYGLRTIYERCEFRPEHAFDFITEKQFAN